MIVLAGLSGCGNSKADIEAIILNAMFHPELIEERQHLRVGVLAGPYADMFTEAIKPALISKGYTVEIIFFTEWDRTNLALARGEIDLNLFQHSFFLNNFKFEYNLELSAFAELPTAPMVIYSNRSNSLFNVSYGTSVALPGDATNLARALRILYETDIISLNPQTDIGRVTLDDIVANPRNLSFNLVDGFAPFHEQISGSEMAIITGAQAYASGLDLADALYREVLRDGYLIVAVVRTEDLPRRFVYDILNIIHSDMYKDFFKINDSPFGGFQWPRYFF